MRQNHLKFKKLLTFAAASAAGVLVYLPASALVGSFGGNNTQSPGTLSQGLPSSPVPTMTPTLPETSTPTPLPTTESVPTPLPTTESTPTPLPTGGGETPASPAPEVSPSPIMEEATPSPAPDAEVDTPGSPTPGVEETTPETTPSPSTEETTPSPSTEETTPRSEDPGTSGTVKTPEKGSWACLNNPNPACK